MRVVLATNNAGKIREFKSLLHKVNIELLSQAELGINDIEETGLTFIENALLKARHASKMADLPAIADDSGLVVKALNGAPGIYSARYAGFNSTSNENIQKLLSELKDVPDISRNACFHCALVFMTHSLDPIPIVCEGNWEGKILHTIKGEEGFGYDPVFYLPTEKKTAAELPIEVKNKISHRGKAVQLLLQRLSGIL